MRRRSIVAAGLSWSALSGCVTTTAQQTDALTPTASAVALRTIQSRRFDTADQTLMMSSALGALQDLGFSIEESQATSGIIVGTKLSGALLRAQVTVRPTNDRAAVIVRSTFQRIIPRPGAMLAVGETLDDPELYRGFFEKIAQSTFLTAHEI